MFLPERKIQEIQVRKREVIATPSLIAKECTVCQNLGSSVGQVTEEEVSMQFPAPMRSPLLDPENLNSGSYSSVSGLVDDLSQSCPGSATAALHTNTHTQSV